MTKTTMTNFWLGTQRISQDVGFLEDAKKKNYGTELTSYFTSFSSFFCYLLVVELFSATVNAI